MRKIELLLEGFHNGESWLFLKKKQNIKKKQSLFFTQSGKSMVKLETSD